MCLKDADFRKYWYEDDDYENVLSEESRCYTFHEIWEKLNALTEDDLNNIVGNKGIKTEIKSESIIEFYEKDGDCPVRDFLNDILNNKLKSKILKDITKLSLLGNKARMPLSRYVEDGILELRTEQNSNYSRIFYFFVFGNKIILTNGYVKKTNKLDKEELNKAKKYRDEYMNR